MLLLFVVDVRGAVNLSICSLGLTFMFLEAAFGICVGCKMYNGLPGTWGTTKTSGEADVCGECVRGYVISIVMDHYELRTKNTKKCR